MDQQRNLEGKLRRLEGLLHLYRLGLGAAVLVIVVLTVLLFYTKVPRFGRMIIVNGKTVAMVRNEKAARAVRERLLAQTASPDGGRATFREKWEDAPGPADGAQILSVAEAVRVLRPKVTVVREAFAIENSGCQLVIVPTREMAVHVLDKLKARYGAPADAVVRQTRLQPNPMIRPCTAVPEDIVVDELQAVARLANARCESQKYVVREGDFPERIARAHDMTVADLWRLNPGFRGQSLHPGQQLVVMGARAGLTVITVKETIATQTIPPPVIKQQSTVLSKGQRKIAQPGRPGQKRIRFEVTMNDDREVARRQLGQEIIYQPQPQVVLVGAGA